MLKKEGPSKYPLNSPIYLTKSIDNENKTQDPTLILY